MKNCLNMIQLTGDYFFSVSNRLMTKQLSSIIKVQLVQSPKTIMLIKL